jgi:phenylalanyl-tRNA synthetase beta chain
MLISYEWLRSLVPLTVGVEEFARRMMLAGFNHESTTPIGDDFAVDLEITSNRPDCLGHIGLAREAAVLFGSALQLPAAAPKASGSGNVSDLASVRIDCPQLCRRFTARVIRGVKIKSSPAWLVKRLTAIGQPAINNVVDITNYVLMECSQPLHAYDLAHVRGKQIIVRDARAGEKFAAINHKTYDLAPGTCVIADAERAVGLGGVMGGVDSEVSPSTVDLLIEAADFDPLSIRNTARKLGLRSDSSYRFERGVDPEGVDWASRRCCELILELAGGELADGVIDVGSPRPARTPITLRLSQLERILGIDIPGDEVRRILLALGCREEGFSNDIEIVHEAGGYTIQTSPEPMTPEEVDRFNAEQERAEAETIAAIKLASATIREELDRAIGETAVPMGRGSVTVVPPSWRRDLEREIDLIEEAARIYGYDAIPEDVSVPMAPSARTDQDRVLARIRHVLTACGFDEALTISVVDAELSSAFSPWTDAAPLALQMPILERADRLRRSLVPSLLKARRENEAVGNRVIELFETANVYLPHSTDFSQANGQLPQEELMLGLTSGRDFFAVKGAIEAMLAALDPAAQLEVRPAAAADLWAAGRAVELVVGGETVGLLGEVSAAGLKRFELRGKTVVAELKIGPLVKATVLVPRYVPTVPFPAIDRDINLVVDESVRWSDVAATARSAGGDLIESLDLKNVYRDKEKLGPGKKSLLVTLVIRSPERTLTSGEADAVRERITAACASKHGAQLRV